MCGEQPCRLSARAFGRWASSRRVPLRIVPLNIALHTVRKIAYNLSNNYDPTLAHEEHVEIEEEI
jgi:hypothetical protein